MNPSRSTISHPITMGKKTMQRACAAGNVTAVASALREAHVNEATYCLWDSGAGHCTALFLAAAHGHAHLVSYLLERGAHVEEGHVVSGESPLMIATHRNEAGVVQVLMNAGANPWRRDRLGMSSMEVAEVTVVYKNQYFCPLQPIVRIMRAPRGRKRDDRARRKRRWDDRREPVRRQRDDRNATRGRDDRNRNATRGRDRKRQRPWARWGHR
jgi:hypothetical protein